MSNRNVESIGHRSHTWPANLDKCKALVYVNDSVFIHATMFRYSRSAKTVLTYLLRTISLAMILPSCECVTE